MSTIPFVSVDMPATGSPGSGSSAPTGQEGIFANHLATASAKQGATVPPAANKTSASTKSGTPEAAETAEAGQPSQISTDSTDQTISTEADTPSEQTATAGADSAAIDQALLYFTWAAATDLNAAPTIIQTLDNSTAVDRMLGAISASNTASTALQTTMAAPAKQAVVLSPESIQPTAVPEQTQVSTGQSQTETGTTASTAPSAPLPQERTTGEMAAASLSAQASDTAAAKATAQNAQTTSQSAAPAVEQNAVPVATNTTGTQTASQSVALQQNATRQGFSQIGQGEYTQIISVHQSNLRQESTSASAPESTANATVTTSDSISGTTRQDTNQNAIQAKLPNEVGTTEQGQANTQQQGDLNGQQQNSPSAEPTVGQPQTETLLAQKPQIILSQDGQPLIFANTREAATPFVPGSTVTTPTTEAMLRLPSGLVVPEGTAIEQMITRLSVNQQLETGTVNLRLYPQELGELRMEIKIEQDNIKAHIITQNPHTQEMIDRHIPRLREALEQQGLHLQEVEVTIAANDNGNDHRYQDNSRQQQLNRSMQSSITQPAIRIEQTELVPEPEYNNSSNLSILA